MELIRIAENPRSMYAGAEPDSGSLKGVRTPPERALLVPEGPPGLPSGQPKIPEGHTQTTNQTESESL